MSDRGAAREDEGRMQEIKPVGQLDATLHLPGSKSYSQRAMVVAALAEGKSHLQNVLVAEDTRYLTEALRLLGADISGTGEDLVVSGTGGNIHSPGRDIFLGNNGTALRLLTSVVCLGKGRFILTGVSRLCERPVQPLLDALAKMGINARSKTGTGCPPVLIEANGIPGGRITLVNIESSQYVSSLLISAPYAGKDVEIVLEGRTVSQPYIDLTLEVMSRFGVQVATRGENTYSITCGQRYKGRAYRVEGDVSSASYFFLAAAIVRGRCKVFNINPQSLQGDIGVLGIMEELGCAVAKGADWVEVTGGALREGEYIVNMGDMPDMVPTIAVLAAFRPGRTVITNVAHLRLKESNRIEALVVELNRMGIMAEEREDGLVVTGGTPHGAEIETYHDHRIAMSFAVAGLAVPGIKIKNPRCVDKSFPGFWEEMAKATGREKKA